ncbi:hypothetical protein [Escherichia coli]|uniref:hypothetical protein n=1 Tax=Escherichia coli TaxID=562 RepID=UPI00102E0E35|nr:hypothetical protein [Escherichia coli]MDZ3910820.1 hypothetical protein [Escherichia coli]RZY70033.1 hypothetical protein EXX27_19075 [Escherichia coli]
MKVINLIFPVLLSMSIPIDMLNGYVLNTYDTGVVSQIYKSFIILVCFSILIIKKPLVVSWYISAVIFLVCGSAFVLALSGGGETISETVQIAIRCMMFFIVMTTLTYLNPSKEFIGKICATLLILLFVNFLLGFFGFGYSSYGNELVSVGDSMGVKGYFYSGNELSFVIMIFSLFSVCYFKNEIVCIFAMSMLLFCSVMLSTKASLASTAIIFAVWAFGKTNAVVKAFTTIIIMIFTVLFFDDLISKVISSDIVSRLSWMYETGGLLRAVLSDRDTFIIDALNQLNLLDFSAGYVFGFGRDYLTFSGVKSSTEMDFVDVYLWFGIPGIIFFVSYFYKLKRLLNKITYEAKNNLICVAFFCMTLFVSFVAGHIVYSGTAVIPLCLVLYALGKEGIRERGFSSSPVGC